MENTKVKAEVLNDLIEINNDRIAGYERAIEELDDANTDLVALFRDMIQESRNYNMELISEVQKTGAEIEEGTTASGKIYRAWMDVKAMFTGSDRKAVLASCEGGEDAAQKAYKMAIEENELAPDTLALIQKQKASLKLSHDKIKALRDSEV
uniref:DUF2383 domain-containing protein n=1 Tax=Sphingobacterium sp. (strain 21) TaxID=743722 RepID=F4CCA6_SPHS2